MGEKLAHCITVKELRLMLASPELDEDAPVLVEVFDQDDENHLGGLRSVTQEERCGDNPALFLQGDQEADDGRDAFEEGS